MAPAIASPWNSRENTKDFDILFLVFVLTRIALRLWAGVQFQTDILEWFWQYLDPVLLKTDLFRSLWYLHSQPPLFNFFLGAVLKVAAASSSTVFELVFRLGGLALTWTSYALMRQLGIRRVLSVIFAALICANPGTLLFESVLFYPLFEGLLGVVIPLLLFGCLRSEKPTAGFAAFAMAVSLLCLLRASFHLVFALGFAAVPLALLRHHAGSRARWVALLLVFALPFLVYAKNWMLFGSPSASTWLGMNLSRGLLEQLPRHELQGQIAEKRLSPWALVGPFRPVSRYFQGDAAKPPYDHPALSAPLKSSGEVNYNHFAYIEISRVLGRDTLNVILQRPGLYLNRTRKAWKLFFEPVTRWPNTRNLITQFQAWDQFFDRWVLLQLNDSLFLTPTVLMPLSLVWMLWVSVHALRHSNSASISEMSQVRAWAWILIGAFVVAIAVPSNFTEVGENQRFRFAVEPVLWITVAGVLERVILSVGASSAQNQPLKRPSRNNRR